MHARNADCSGVRLSWEMGLNISAISSATAKRWIKNDEDDFDIGVKNGVEHSPGELLWLCSRVVYTLKQLPKCVVVCYVFSTSFSMALLTAAINFNLLPV